MRQRIRLLAVMAVLLLSLSFSIAEAAARGTVRVELTSLGNPTAVEFAVRGGYTFSDNSLPFLSDGDRVTICVGSNSGMKVTVNGTTYPVGRTLTLRRGDSSFSCGLQLQGVRQPDCLYNGDLTVNRLSREGGDCLQSILAVYMEDYLKGVLPWQMGEDAEPDALKAQAVAARSYALCRMNARAAEKFDVVDTVQDQVYWGASSAFVKSNAAVESTRGIILQWCGAPAEALYTASNGGQTESAANAWGSVGYEYLSVKDDPYDMANGQASCLTYFIPKDLTHAEEPLRSLMQHKAQAALGGGYALRSVQSVVLHTPRYSAPSRLYTQLDCAVTVRKNGNDRKLNLTFDVFGELETPLGMSLNGAPNELWTVTREKDGFRLTARRYGHGIGLSQRGAMLMADTGWSYDDILAFYYEGCDLAQVTLLNAAGQVDHPASLPGYEQGTAIVNTADGGWLNLRLAPDQTSDILAFIPNGSQVTLLDAGGQWQKVCWQEQTGYVLSAFLTYPAVQPQATAQPASSYAYVNTANGGLNMRGTPDQNGEIIQIIPQYTIIPVYGENDGWVRTFYQGSWGYVMTRYLLLQSDGAFMQPETDLPEQGVKATPAPAVPVKPAPMPIQPGDEVRVNNGGNALDMHVLPDASSPVMLAIPDGDYVRVEDYDAQWSCVTWQECTGYVESSRLAADGLPQPEQTTAQAWIVTGLNGGVNLRTAPSYEAEVIYLLKCGTGITVTGQTEGWYAVSYANMSGYVAGEFVTFSQPAPEPENNAQGSSGPHTAATLYVAASGYLNMRSVPDMEGEILRQLPRGSAVILIVDQGEWSFISFEHQMGYVLSRLLSETPPDTVESAPQESGDAMFDPTLRTAGGWAVVMPDEGLQLRMWCRKDAPAIVSVAAGALVEVR